jgi:diphosphomevalonate decarboxylase
MNRREIVQNITNRRSNPPKSPLLRGTWGIKVGCAFAPVNIALVKYWGKRDQELNLPVTDSLSISLGDKGAYTTISEKPVGAPLAGALGKDEYIINGKKINKNSDFYKKLKIFLDLFRPAENIFYQVTSEVNVPIAAGLASSACGFAALVKALNNLYNWQLTKRELSILARLGSGSASRSVDTGFVEWQAGESSDGMDSFALPISCNWPELRIGLLIINSAKKPIASREAMQKTIETSQLYREWPAKVDKHLKLLKQAIANKDFKLLGETAEANSEAMHAIMADTIPAINYSQPETVAAITKIKQLRSLGINIYFTQDAGPNLKLLFLAKDTEKIINTFSKLEIIAPFADPNVDQVVLVDEHDRDLGVMEKLAAHQQGKLHRAFSVFIYRKTGNKIEVLLQQRQQNKYHSGGLWTNACCSHPQPGEDIISAATRRLQEEMGIVVDLVPIGKFCYRAELDKGLTEHELDYVLIGESKLDPVINQAEVQDFKWLELTALQNDLKKNPKKYTAWFGSALKIFSEMDKFV